MDMKKQVLERIERLRLEILLDSLRNHSELQNHHIFDLNRKMDDLLVQYIRNEIDEEQFQMLHRRSEMPMNN